MAQEYSGWNKTVLLDRVWGSTGPTFGCEISCQGVSVGRWAASSSRLEALAWKPFSPAAIEASPLRENLRQPDEVREALGAALAAIGQTPAAAGSRSGIDIVLVIPDSAARLFVLSFDTLPRQSAEVFSLVKWRLKKSVPFDIDTAAVSYFAQRADRAYQVVSVATPQAIIREYESLVEAAGLRPRWVTLSTLAALGLLRSTNSVSRAGTPVQGKNWIPGVIVAKYSPPWFTTVVLQGEQVRLFRSVDMGNTVGGMDAAKVLEALYPSIVYFQDNFSAPLGTAYLCGFGEGAPAVAELLDRELRLQAEPLQSGLQLGATGSERSQEEQHFAALLGMVAEGGRG